MSKKIYGIPVATPFQADKLRPVIVTVNPDTNKSTHDSYQINDLVNAGNTVILHRESVFYSLTTHLPTMVQFTRAFAMGSDTVCVTTITISGDSVSESVSIANRGSGDGGGQSDWNASEIEEGHIKNRTHWTEITRVEIFPETSIVVPEGKSEATLSLNSSLGLKDGETYRVVCNGTEYECVTQHPGVVGGGTAYLLGNGDEFGLETNGEPFYVLDVNGSSSSINVKENCTIYIYQAVEVIHKIDPKYLPDDIGGGMGGADWNAAEGEAGHVLNRTHYEETALTEVPFNFTFDGDMTGKEVIDLTEEMGMYLVKMTNAVLSADDLIGATCTAVSGEQEVSNEITADLIADVNGDGSILGTDLFMAVQYDCDFAGTIFTPGLYFPCFPGVAYCKALVKEGATVTEEKTTLKKLDPKYLPDGAPYLEVRPSDGLPETVVANYDQEKGKGEITPYLDILPGGLFTVTYNGVEYRCKAQKMEQDGAIFTILGDGSSLGLTGNGEPFMVMCLPNALAITEGIGAVVMVTDNPKSVTLKIEGTNRIAYPLSRELLPATDLINIRAYPDYTQVKLDATSATRITLTEEDRMILVNAKDSGIVKLNVWLDINGTCRFFTCTVSLIYSPENIYGTCLLHDGTYLVMQLVGNILHMWHKSKPGQI